MNEELATFERTVGEIRKMLCYGVDYKLIGAMTGKTLAKSWVNKEEFIRTFDGETVPNGAIYSTIETREHGYGNSAFPVICVWVSGK